MTRSINALVLIIPALYVTLSGTAQDDAPAKVSIEYEGLTVGHIEELTISAPDVGRLEVSLETSLPRLRDVIDRRGLAQGNLSDSSFGDLYWRADTTRLRGASGRTLRLSTLLAVDCFLCLPNATVRVRWDLRLEPSGLRTVSAVARTTDIVGVADWIEDALDLHQTIRFTLPLLEECAQCMCLQDELNVSRGSTRFAIRDGIVWLRASYTVDDDLTSGLSCLLDLP